MSWAGTRSTSGIRRRRSTDSSERNDVARYLAECNWETVGTTLEQLITATVLAGLRPEDLAELSLSTRYVTAVRNAPAPATLDS
jgi:hypothetical protein